MEVKLREKSTNWKRTQLVNLAKNEKSSFVIGPFGSDLVQSDYRSSGVPVVFVRDIKRNKFKWKSNVYLTEDKAAQLHAHSVLPGDIIVTKMGLPPGIAALYPYDMETGIVTADILRLRPNTDKVDPTFLCNYLNSYHITKQVHQRTAGQTRPKLTLADYKTIKINLPPLLEQKKIARILSTWDKSIETVEKLIENSKAQKKALMQQLLTGKRRLPGFDEEWKTIRLDDVLDGKKRKGKIVPTNDEKRGVAYIGSTSFNGDFGIYTDSSDAVICSLKDILVLWDGENAGKATTGLSGAVSSTVVRCRIDESKANSRFITYNLLKDNYKVTRV